MAFLLIMVATGWVWSRAHGERESSFFRRERERVPRGRSIQEREEKLRERKLRVSWVFKLGLLGTSQWLS